MDMLQRWLLTAVCCLVALPAIAGELVVDVLDVGQGDAVLIRTSEKTVLIDAGTAKSAVPRQLRQLGVDRLDLVVATHPHADHIGGMANVTWVPSAGETDGIVAFDTGPGVAVVDAVTRLLFPELRFDEDGVRATAGTAEPTVVERLLSAVLG